MGTFEKLGILVIVIIIVMILAVAISQWGGIASETSGALAESPSNETLTIRNLDDIARDYGDAEGEEQPVASGPDEWSGGVPKRYVIERGDKVWVLVVKRWKLKETFISAVSAANPGLNLTRLRPGQTLVVPDPSGYERSRRKAAKPGDGARVYEVQNGDNLERIAKKHLGSKTRWREISKLNPGIRPERLMPGQRILVPAR